MMLGRERLHRSELAVPATSPRFIEKATQCSADAVFLDLEDSVVPELKAQARRNAIEALNELDWGPRTISVRVNALDTEWGCRDIIEIAEACPRLDRILLPKCDTPAHLMAVELMLCGIERGHERARRIGIEALIETAKGVANVEAIAATGERLEALIFGAGDYQLDMRIDQRSVGAPNMKYAVLTDAAPGGERERHWNDPWHFALARVANACRAYGRLPIDGPFTNIADPQGLRAAAERAAALGFEGKWAIHPSQIEVANEVFSPSAEQLVWAREVLAAIAAGGGQGRGAVRSKDGNMIDMAHVKMAKALLERGAQVAKQSTSTRA
jgi:malyl-CoA/(S)-citramalyl-CoA lyase